VITRSDDVPELDGAAVHAIVAPATAPEVPVLDHLAHAAAVYRTAAKINEHERVHAVVAPLWCSEGIVCVLDEQFPTVITCMTSMATVDEIRAAGDPALEALERSLMRRARYLHGLTRGSIDKTLADFQADPVEVGVVGRGLFDRAGTAAPEGTRRGDGREILFVGRLEKRKGVDVLLEAARRLAAAGTEFTLTLVGPDMGDSATGETYSAAFERESGAGRHALAGRVRFEGAIDDDELTRCYRRADIVCLPSRYESHGVALIEAMMFGKPIVACKAGGVPEVVDEGGNALLATPGDPESLASCLRALLADPDLRRRFGARSRALYEERFEAGAVADQMTSFLGGVAQVHRYGRSAPPDLANRLATVVGEVLPMAPAHALATAEDLLAPSADSWRVATRDAHRELAAWQARAYEAERQRDEAERALAAVSGSRSWRLTRVFRGLRSIHRSRPQDGA
jgi:glycogen(starch) synthase